MSYHPPGGWPFKRLRSSPGGTTFTICVNMCVRKFSEKGAFSERGSDLSRSEIMVSFLAELGNKGTFLVTVFIARQYLGMF